MRIGLVLSGGAARGFAHLGVLKALDELQIKISIISGTSSGAIAGAFYAAGYSPDQIFELAFQTNIIKLMRPAFSRFGLLKLDQVEKIFHEYFGQKTFEDLNPKLIICATDINRATSVYFSEGPIVQPLLASSALPIIYKPIVYQDRVLIDGGLLNNMPVECLTGETDFIIGVHTNPVDYQSDINSFKDLCERTFHLAINNNVQPRLKLCNFLIEPPGLRAYSLMNIKNARTMVNIGYEHTLKLADNLQSVIADFAPTTKPTFPS